MLNPLSRARLVGGIPRGTRDGRSHVAGVPDELAIEIDADGSPVSFPAADWFICFVPGLQKQWWHRFVSANYQHVFAMRMVDDSCWILIEPWWTRMLVNVLTLDEAVKFLRWGAAGHILQVREAIPGCGNQARGWSNCAVLTSFLLGRRYWTWTPRGLYRRLAAEQGARPIDFAQWLANHMREIANRNVDRAMSGLEGSERTSVQTALVQLGNAIMSALLSRSGLGIYKVAISESSRFSAAATAYWQYAPERAIEAVRKVLEQARLRGEISIEEPADAARQFFALLRGDLHLQMLFGLRRRPDLTEIHARVTSAVDLLLNGALVTRSECSYTRAALRPQGVQAPPSAL
jgi:hypothetical protein